VKSSPPRATAASEALHASREMIANPGVIDSSQETNGVKRIEELQRMLTAARQQRLEKNTTLAVTTLTSILNAEAPDDIYRAALLELAVSVQQDGQYARAQQVFAQFLSRYPDDPNVPEILLRQGLLYRQMGANTLALSKFYAVMTSALNLKADRFEYYQRLVLQAQTEIADTYYLLAQYAEAADFFGRLLKLETADLNRPLIQSKLIRSMSNLGRHPEVVAQAQDFLGRYTNAPELPEMRFLLANSLKQLGRNREALQHVLKLLEGQRDTAGKNLANWIYWQQRTGNEIANQLYKEGDYVNALEIYLNLAHLDNSLAWQMPVWYQIGLVYERLNQPQKAVEYFDKIQARQKELGTNAPPSLQAVLDMARWRKGFVGWQSQAEEKTRQLQAAAPESPPNVATP
jgi:tetratricopeptide (TPR) repeat protein